jgi:hypothetical protein
VNFPYYILEKLNPASDGGADLLGSLVVVVAKAIRLLNY